MDKSKKMLLLFFNILIYVSFSTSAYTSSIPETYVLTKTFAGKKLYQNIGDTPINPNVPDNLDEFNNPVEKMKIKDLSDNQIKTIISMMKLQDINEIKNIKKSVQACISRHCNNTGIDYNRKRPEYQTLVRKICEAAKQNLIDFWLLLVKYLGLEKGHKEDLLEAEKLYVILTVFTQLRNAIELGYPIEKTVDEIVKLLQPSVSGTQGSVDIRIKNNNIDNVAEFDESNEDKNDLKLLGPQCNKQDTVISYNAEQPYKFPSESQQKIDIINLPKDNLDSQYLSAYLKHNTESQNDKAANDDPSVVISIPQSNYIKVSTPLKPIESKPEIKKKNAKAPENVDANINQEHNKIKNNLSLPNKYEQLTVPENIPFGYKEYSEKSIPSAYSYNDYFVTPKTISKPISQDYNTHNKDLDIDLYEAMRKLRLNINFLKLREDYPKSNPKIHTLHAMSASHKKYKTNQKKNWWEKYPITSSPLEHPALVHFNDPDFENESVTKHLPIKIRNTNPHDLLVTVPKPKIIPNRKMDFYRNLKMNENGRQLFRNPNKNYPSNSTESKPKGSSESVKTRFPIRIQTRKSLDVFGTVPKSEIGLSRIVPNQKLDFYPHKFKENNKGEDDLNFDKNNYAQPNLNKMDLELFKNEKYKIYNGDVGVDHEQKPRYRYPDHYNSPYMVKLHNSNKWIFPNHVPRVKNLRFQKKELELRNKFDDTNVDDFNFVQNNGIQPKVNDKDHEQFTNEKYEVSNNDADVAIYYEPNHHQSSGHDSSSNMVKAIPLRSRNNWIFPNHLSKVRNPHFDKKLRNKIDSRKITKQENIVTNNKNNESNKRIRQLMFEKIPDIGKRKQIQNYRKKSDGDKVVGTSYTHASNNVLNNIPEVIVSVLQPAINRNRYSNYYKPQHSNQNASIQNESDKEAINLMQEIKINLKQHYVPDNVVNDVMLKILKIIPKAKESSGKCERGQLLKTKIYT